MGKQSKSRKKPDGYGTGNVTPIQIAFLVDRYLLDNGYAQSRNTFRSEASRHFTKSPAQEAPKSLLSLAAILDDYINLKGQKVMLDQEICRLEHEKYRVQTLLQGMQDVMNAYNVGSNGQNLLQQNLLPSLVSSVTAKSPPQSLLSSVTAKSAAMVPQMDLVMGSPAGYLPYSTPLMIPALRPSSTHIDQSSLTPPVANNSAAKRRKSSKDASDAQVNAKKSRNSLNQLSVKGTNDLPHAASAANNQSSRNNNTSKNTAQIQGSSIAKCLFDKATPSPPTNMSIPKTPHQASSSHTDKSVSPLQTSSTATSADHMTSQQMTSTNCILISSETISVSPAKELARYSVQNHCISSSSPIKTNLMRLNMRDHVKGRLDFDSSDCLPYQGNWVSDDISVHKSCKEGDIFDLDLPNLDVLGVDFSLSELLSDFDADAAFSSQAIVDSSPSSHSGSPGDTWDTESGAHQVFTKSSTVTEIVSEKDMNVQGQQAVTSVRSRTKSIKIISPVKNNGSSYSGQENKDVVN